ncbi:hypothetical protein DST30_11335 [Salmonella enterica subsp. enterica serovar Panama]|nr:hypothetical protein [Salmonella enterica subsp. enterica serovar Panama]
MYPERTWQEDVLSRLNQHIHQPLTLSDITITPDWYSNTGRIRLSINPAPQSRYYSDDPVSIYLQRRDISKLFIHHQPYVIVANATTVADCLSQLFQKYGLVIDLAIFDQDTLAQSIVFETQEKTVSIAIRVDASESWYGTFQFVAKKAQSNNLTELFVVKTPLTSYYPEDQTQSGIHALSTYGILLDVPIQGAIRRLAAGTSPTGRAAYCLATALSSMDYTLAWELITNATVVYNGITSDSSAPVKPPFGESVLVLKPHPDSGISSQLYFSYD